MVKEKNDESFWGICVPQKLHCEYVDAWRLDWLKTSPGINLFTCSLITAARYTLSKKTISSFEKVSLSHVDIRCPWGFTNHLSREEKKKYEKKGLQQLIICLGLRRFPQSSERFGPLLRMIDGWCKSRVVKNGWRTGSKNTKKFSRSFCVFYLMKVTFAHHEKASQSLSRTDYKKQEYFLLRHWKNTNTKYRTFSLLRESIEVEYHNSLCAIVMDPRFY